METSNLERMVHQHILEYESRLKHMDELLARVHAAGVPTAGEDAEQLAGVLRERDALSGQLDTLRQQPPPTTSSEAFETYGPMGVWDTVANKLENLVERLER
jgi:hypothetical protein